MTAAFVVETEPQVTTGEPFDVVPNVATIRKATDAERAAKRKALLAEAFAWERVAWRIDAFGRPSGYAFGYAKWIDSTTVARAMAARHVGHGTHYPELDAEAVLAALFLALECADEAAALKSSTRKEGSE